MNIKVELISNKLNYDRNVFYQYDYGHILEFRGFDIPDGTQIHFANKGNTAYPVISHTVNGITTVPVPQKVLELNGEMIVYVFASGDTYGHTTHAIDFNVRQREKPGNYAPPDEPNVIEQLSAKLQQIIDTGIANYEPDPEAVEEIVRNAMQTDFITNNDVATIPGTAWDAVRGKAIRDDLGNLADLTTSNKKVVGAINEVKSYAANLFNNVTGFSVSVVTSLPTSNIDAHTIYFVHKSSSANDNYDEYMYINSSWEHIGSTTVDLTNYINKTGDLKDNIVSFTEASSLSNINSNESVATIFGKIKKFFNFIGTATLDTVAENISAAINELKTAITGKLSKYNLDSATAGQALMKNSDGSASFQDLPASSSSGNGSILKTILKLMLDLSGSKTYINAWSDQIDDTSRINTSLSNGYYFDSTNKSLKVSSTPTSGLQSEYKFDSNANDTSGNAHNGTATNVTYNTGKFNQSVSINGTSSKISLGYAAIPATGDFTVCGWCKRKSDTIGSSYPGTALMLIQESSGSSAGRSNIISRPNSGIGISGVLGEQMHTVSAPVDTWYFFAISRTGSSLSLWVNTNKQTFTYNGSIEQTPTIIGAINITDFAGAPFELDNLRIYNRVLTDSEITQLYNETLSPVGTIIWNAWASDGVLTKMAIEANQTLGTGSITYYISRDGGTTFTQCSLDTTTSISGQPSGTNIVLKAVMSGNAELFAVSDGGE